MTSVMSGVRNGVCALFKKDHQHLIAIHCIAHRLALASSQSSKCIPYLVKYEEILNKIYKYFDNSPKHSRQLAEIQDAFQHSKIKYVQVFATRWLSFSRCVDAVLKNWSSLVSVLLADTSPVAQGLLKNISTYKFLYITYFLADVLHVLKQLCLVFQKAEISIDVVQAEVAASTNALEILTNSKGVTESEFLPQINEIDDAIPGKVTFQGHDVISMTEKMKAEVVTTKAGFLQALLQNIHERLSDIGKISMFCIFNPSQMPDQTDPSFATYGNAELEAICKHMNQKEELFCPTAVKLEWSVLKHIICTRCRHMNVKEFMKFLSDNQIGNSTST